MTALDAPEGWYDIRCPECGAMFTPVAWETHRPDCVFESHGGRKDLHIPTEEAGRG